MDGFKRPVKNNSKPAAPPPPRVDIAPSPRTEPTPPLPDELPLSRPTSYVQPAKSPRRRWWIVIVAVVVVMLLSGLAAVVWFYRQLEPADPGSKTTQSVEIKEGATLSSIAEVLQSHQLIRNKTAFQLYAHATNRSAALKVGVCKISPAASSQQILSQLEKGCTEFKSITFYPGATIEKPLYKPDHAQIDQTMNVKSILAKAGYSSEQIEAALSKQYSSPLFEGKPAGSTLEGYIYGDTYFIESGAPADVVLQRTFDLMYRDIEPLLPAYRAKGLDTFQAITLASIIQRELNCEGKPTKERKERCYGYQQAIAQVFLKRLAEGISLGADATFIYAADMMRVTPTIDLQSPYNTRIHKGLPPGPIGAPGKLALTALANPSQTDYLFYITGDDGLFYFAHTSAEHEANIKAHCQKLCYEL